MTTTENRQVVGVVPPGAPLTATGEVLKGMGACYPTDALTVQNAPNGGFWIVYDPTTLGARAAEHSRANGNVGNYSISTGTVNNDTYDADDADLLTFALQVSEENETLGIQAIAQWMKNTLANHDAANYLAFSLNYPEADERYALTIQRVTGLTPAEKIADLEKRLAEATAARDDLQEAWDREMSR